MNWKRTSLFLFFIILLNFNFAFALGEYNKIVEGFSFSLGNSTSCNGISQCNVVTLNFEIPTGIPEQKYDIYIKSQCIGSLNPDDTYNITVYCNDKDETRLEIDLKPYRWCNPPYDYYKFTIYSPENQGYAVYGDKLFHRFFCGIKRNDANIDTIPTKVIVYIDSIAFKSVSLPSTIENETQNSLISTTERIGDIIDINVRLWQLFFIVFEIFIIIVGLFFAIGLVPMVLRWLIEKITN